MAVGGLNTHGEAGPAKTDHGARDADPRLCPHLSPAHTSLPSRATVRPAQPEIRATLMNS